MQTYKSHKTVEAAKIAAKFDAYNIVTDTMFYRLTFGEGPLDFVVVDMDWWMKHSNNGTLDLVGGYLVSYPDAYLSWSPAEVFEDGYRPLDDDAKVYDPKDGALPVAGYKAQTSASVEVVNGNKRAEEAVLRILDTLETYPGIDRRWLAIGRTAIEQGWMAVNRAVFKPGRAELPEDSEMTIFETAKAARAVV